jgi:hypothetical protein
MTMPKTTTKTIRIRALPAERGTDGLLYYVEQESTAAIHLDNRAPNAMFRTRVTLSKMPDGTLENSAGQKFEIVPERNEPKPICKLSGANGNVFNVMGLVRRALRDAGQSEQAEEFIARAVQSEDYDTVLQLCFEYVEVV